MNKNILKIGRFFKDLGCDKNERKELYDKLRSILKNRENEGEWIKTVGEHEMDEAITYFKKHHAVEDMENLVTSILLFDYVGKKVNYQESFTKLIKKFELNLKEVIEFNELLENDRTKDIIFNALHKKYNLIDLYLTIKYEKYEYTEEESDEHENDLIIEDWMNRKNVFVYGLDENF